MIAEHTKRHPNHSTDLQSLCYGSLSLFAVCGFLTSGFLVTSIGSMGIFQVLSIVGIAVFITGVFNLLGEKRMQGYDELLDYTSDSVNSATPSESSDSSLSSTKTVQNGRKNIRTFFGCIHIDIDFISQFKVLLQLASFACAMALLVGVIVLFFDQFEIRLTAVILAAIVVVVAVLILTREYYSPIGKTALFFFFVNALAPDTDVVFFYWYTSYENGPKFSPAFVGYIFAVSYFGMFIGVLFYNR